MPRLRAVPDHVRRRAHHRADRARVDQLSRRLKARAQKRVRRAAQIQPVLLRQRHQLPPQLRRGRQRLLGIHMLSRRQRGARYLKMLRRTGEVQNNLHLRIAKRVLHRLVN